MSRTYIPKTLRQKVAQQAHHRCGYCLTLEKIIGAPMEIEHLVPESLGGETVEENLWLAYSYCNDYKNDRISAVDPDSNEIVFLFNPRQQVWQDHFEWDQDATQIIGLTSTGRATVVALKLNRPHLVYSRTLWVMAGWHPPKDE